MHGEDSYPTSLATGESPSKDSEIVCYTHSCRYTRKQYEESRRIHSMEDHMYHRVRQCGCSSKESIQFPDGGAQGQTRFPLMTFQAGTPDSYKKLLFLYQTREGRTNFQRVSLSGREEKCRRRWGSNNILSFGKVSGSIDYTKSWVPLQIFIHAYNVHWLYWLSLVTLTGQTPFLLFPGNDLSWLSCCLFFFFKTIK